MFWSCFGQEVEVRGNYEYLNRFLTCHQGFELQFLFANLHLLYQDSTASQNIIETNWPLFVELVSNF